MEILKVLVIVYSFSNCAFSYPFFNGDIRLIGGAHIYEGTVLVFHDNKWGSICDYHWDIRDAHVVCRQLGYPRALQHVHGSTFGRGRRRQWLTDVYCRGDESRLSECYFPGWGRFYSRHERACRGSRHSAGVVCLSIESTLAPSTLPHFSGSAVINNNNVNNLLNSQASNHVLLGDEADTIPVSRNRRLNVTNQSPTSTTTLPTTTTPRTTTTTTTKPTTTTKRTTPSTTTTTSTTTTPTKMTAPKATITTKMTTPTSKTTNKPTTTTQDIAAQLPYLPMGSWRMDKQIEMWVMRLRSGQYLVAKPGSRTKKVTKEQYISIRRELIKPPATTTPSYIFVSNNEANEVDEADGPQHETRKAADDPVVVLVEENRENTESSQDLRLKEEKAKDVKDNDNEIDKNDIDRDDDIDKDVDEMLKEDTKEKGQLNISYNVKNSSSRVTPTTTTTTTKKPTTTPTTTTTTTPPTTTSRTTTQVRLTRESIINDRASNLPSSLVDSTWILDNEAKLWVLKLRNGDFMVSVPGETPQKMTRGQYIQKRREMLQSQATTTTISPPTQQQVRQQSSARDRHYAVADDPSVRSNTISLSNRQSGTLINIAEGGNSVQVTSNRDKINSNSADAVIGGMNNRHRHRHGNNSGRRHQKIQIKVSGGRTGLDGRLEVLPPNHHEWGVICGDEWSLKEAIVACRHFGLGYGMQAAKTAYYGGKNQKKYFSSVKCKGTEKTLDKCTWEDHNGLIQCTRSDAVAAIVCSKTLPDLEPSTYMVESTTFLQDRHMYYLTCAMEENCLAPSAYEIRKTSRNWRTSTRRLMRFSSVVKNIGTADFLPKSQRQDWEWHACHMHYHSMEVFAHYDITDMNGNRVAEGLKASFCLEDSQCNRGVFPKYDCQNWGQQGISVGCSDNYMADIDCQWIDITDLKPGNYHFKLEVNPNFLVPEITFENNGMNCDFHYSGYYARITNCKLRSLL